MVLYYLRVGYNYSNNVNDVICTQIITHCGIIQGCGTIQVNTVSLEWGLVAYTTQLWFMLLYFP